MNITIFIRTYHKDAEWLEYCLRSIRKHEPDDPVVLVTTPASRKTIQPFADKYGCRYAEHEPVHEDGYVDQQWSKIHADTWCDTEYIAYIDSDCLLLKPSTHLFTFGKPTLLKTPFAELAADKNVMAWRPIITRYLGFVPEFEYMRRQGMVFPRAMYAPFRATLEEENGPIADWFPKIRARKFSEYNLMGAWCDANMHDAFYWVDTSKELLPEPVIRQGWSWGGLEKVKEEWDAIINA